MVITAIVFMDEPSRLLAAARPILAWASSCVSKAKGYPSLLAFAMVTQIMIQCGGPHHGGESLGQVFEKGEIIHVGQHVPFDNGDCFDNDGKRILTPPQRLI